MNGITSTRCYIEEYEVGQGRIAARLREKATGRKVDICATTLDAKQSFLMFLSSARVNSALIPDVFSRDGINDHVIVSSDADFDAPDEIRYVFNERLSYLFG